MLPFSETYFHVVYLQVQSLIQPSTDFGGILTSDKIGKSKTSRCCRNYETQVIELYQLLFTWNIGF